MLSIIYGIETNELTCNPSDISKKVTEAVTELGMTDESSQKKIIAKRMFGDEDAKFSYRNITKFNDEILCNNITVKKFKI